MALKYVTAVKIPAINAQSVQIFSMSEQFSLIDGDFLLLSPGEVLESDPGWWSKISLFFNSGRLKYLEFAFRTFFSNEITKDDVIYTRDVLIAALFALKGLSVVYEVHQRPSKKSNFLIRNVLKGSGKGKYVTISSALKSYMLGEFGLLDDDVTVLHSAVNYFQYEQNKPNRNVFNEFGVPADKQVVLHTGSLYAGRGAELFEDILNSDLNVALVHIGGSENDLTYWREKYKNHAFYAIPHVERELLVTYQLSADCLLFPMTEQTKTYWCCSPMKLFEYFAAGRPVVASTIGSLSEIVSNDNAFLFSHSHKGSIVSAVRDALESKDAQRRGREGRRQVMSKYNWPNRAKEAYAFSMLVR